MLLSMRLDEIRSGGISDEVRQKLGCWAPTTYRNEGWEVVNYPLAILEWKAFRLQSSNPLVSRNDVEWLERYSALCPTPFVGYAISLDLLRRQFHICVTRVENGHRQDSWLVM
jgi:hypothetical protein